MVSNISEKQIMRALLATIEIQKPLIINYFIIIIQNEHLYINEKAKQTKKGERLYITTKLKKNVFWYKQTQERAVKIWQIWSIIWRNKVKFKICKVKNKQWWI